MLQRLGLVGRLIVILLLLLIALGLTGIAVSFATRSRDAGVTLRFPLPDQAAAIADLLDSAPESRRELMLRAVNSDDLRVGVMPAPPPPPAFSRSFPVAEWLVGQYLESYRSRHVEVMLLAASDSTLLGRILEWSSPRSTAPLRILMSLKSGEILVLETRGTATQRLFGVPTGFWVGALGALLAALAIWAIVREARPLTELAQSVARFSADATPAAVALRGAPDVRTLIQAVNDMQLRISALLKGRTILLGAVSHDLKTFMTRLRLRVEDIPNDSQRVKAVADLDGMTELIDSAIMVARGAAASERRQQVDIAKLLQDDIAEHDAARVNLLCAPGLPTVAADPMGLKRLVANLIDNALRYGRRCEVRASLHGGLIGITFDDDGPGIPEAERQAVFEPFYRLEPSRSRTTGGSGLGLAIVKQIADAHGARMTISTSPLGGTRIAVMFPSG